MPRFASRQLYACAAAAACAWALRADAGLAALPAYLRLPAHSTGPLPERATSGPEPCSPETRAIHDLRAALDELAAARARYAQVAARTQPADATLLELARADPDAPQLARYRAAQAPQLARLDLARGRFVAEARALADRDPESGIHGALAGLVELERGLWPPFGDPLVSLADEQGVRVQRVSDPAALTGGEALLEAARAQGDLSAHLGARCRERWAALPSDDLAGLVARLVAANLDDHPEDLA
ncbi:MAG: hypothetical protein R3F62_30790 [Planctomycetota bacterium]